MSLEGCTWAAAIGAVVGIVGAIIGIGGFIIGLVEHGDARKFRRLNKPRAEVGRRYPSGRGDYALIVLRKANDDHDLYRAADVQVVSPRHARLSLPTDEPEWQDDYGVSIGNKPGEWEDRVVLENGQSVFYVKPTDVVIELTVKLVGRSDPTIVEKSPLTVPPR